MFRAALGVFGAYVVSCSEMDGITDFVAKDPEYPITFI